MGTKAFRPPKAQEFGAVKAPQSMIPPSGRVLWLQEYHGGVHGYPGFESVLTSEQIAYFVGRGWIGMFLEAADENAERIIRHWTRSLP